MTMVIPALFRETWNPAVSRETGTVGCEWVRHWRRVDRAVTVMSDANDFSHQ